MSTDTSGSNQSFFRQHAGALIGAVGAIIAALIAGWFGVYQMVLQDSEPEKSASPAPSASSLSTSPCKLLATAAGKEQQALLQLEVEHPREGWADRGADPAVRISLR